MSPRFLLLFFLQLGCSDETTEGGFKVSTRDGDTGVSATSECEDHSGYLNLSWPVVGTDGHDWVLVNYVDADRGEGMADYAGGLDGLAKTYDGHRGVDISISSFREMDAGVSVVAAVPGVVEYVIDGFEDRHTECVDYDANIVGVRHSSGHLLHYVHLKTGSVAVSVGEEVMTGDVLGQVGSSGCSTHPHLHFEITDSTGDWVDPFAEDLWCDPPLYETPIHLMETWVIQGPSDQYENPYQDPPAETDVFDVGELLVAHFVVAGGDVGDTVGVSFVGPDGTTVGPWPLAFEQVWRLSTWAWAFNVVEPRGEWSVRYELNGEPYMERTISVE